MRHLNGFIRLSLGVAVAAVLAGSTGSATAATCNVGNNIYFSSADGSESYLPGDIISQWSVIMGRYYSTTLHPEHNGHIAAYVTYPGSATIHYLRYTDNTWVDAALSKDVWICANDYSTQFKVQTQWENFGVPCRNCTFQLGPLTYNGKIFGVDMMGGNDTFNGGGGADWVWGNDGDDVINGGGGVDYGYGGAGTDSQDGTTENFYQN